MGFLKRLRGKPVPWWVAHVGIHPPDAFVERMNGLGDPGTG